MIRRLLEEIRPMSLDDINALPLDTEVEVVLFNLGTLDAIGYLDTELFAYPFSASTSRGLCAQIRIWESMEFDMAYSFTLKRTSGGFNLYKKDNWGLMSTISSPVDNMILKTKDTGNNQMKYFGVVPNSSSGSQTSLSLYDNFNDALMSDNFKWAFDTGNGVSDTLHCDDIYIRLINQGFQLKNDTSPKSVTITGNDTTGFIIATGNYYASISGGALPKKPNAQGYWWFYHINNIQPNKGTDGTTTVWDNATTPLMIQQGENQSSIPNHGDAVRITSGGSYLNYNGNWGYSSSVSASSNWWIFKK